MITIKATTGSKKVTIRKDGEGNYHACLTQQFNDRFQMQDRFIELKSYRSEKAAIKWANKQLV